MNRRLLAATTATCLMALALIGTQSTVSRADTATPASATSPADATTAPDEATAADIATTYDHAVTVSDDTTPTELVTANQDGTMTLDSNVQPVRVQQAGSWIPLNLDLKSGNGWVVPSATAAPVRFSAGGSDTIAQVQTIGGDWVSETWPEGNLPQPTLDADTATYTGVLPGVDLQLTATPTGMAEVLVVHSAAAAANPALADLELTMPNAAVSVDAQQSTVASAPDHSAVTSAPPTWWDSSQPGADASGPGGAGEPAPLAHSTDGDSVNLNVAAAADQTQKYPLYVDPDWSAGQQDYWFTDRAYPNQSYLNGNQSAGYQSVGYASQGGVTYMSRAFWQFGIAPLAGATIQSAKFDVSINYSCASTALNLSWYGPGTPGFTWNNDPNLYHSTEDTITPPSVGGCGITPTTLGFNALTATSYFAGQSKSTMQLAVRAADESGDVTSRKHLGQNATLIVQYDTKPNTPTGLTFTGPSRACGSSVAGAAWMNNAVQGIQVQASQSDPDGGNMLTNFQVSKASSLGTDAIAEFRTGNQAAGTVAPPAIGVNKLANNTDYAIRAETSDGTTWSDWTGWCYFHIANDAPPVPTVTITPAQPTVGSVVTATISTPNAGSRGFVTWMTTGAAPRNQAQAPVNVVTPKTTYHVCDPAATGATYLCSTYDSTSKTYTATMTYTVSDDTSAIYAAALDRAGNLSAVKDSDGNIVTVAGSALVSANPDSTVSLSSGGHAWVGDGTDTAAIADLSTSTATTGSTAPAALTLGTAVMPEPLVGSGRPDLTAGPYPATDLYFSGSTTSATPATTSRPVIDQSKSFSVSAWLAPASTKGTTTSTAVAEIGADGDAFALQQVGGTWQFCLKTQNTAAQQCVSTPTGVSGDPTAGSFTFVTGIWDASSTTTGQMSIVLNANVEDPGTVTTGRAPLSGDKGATGALVVGASSTTNGTPWSGDITDVAIFPGVPDSTQLRGIEHHGDPTQ